jgi:hypothetical protein
MDMDLLPHPLTAQTPEEHLESAYQRLRNELAKN